MDRNGVAVINPNSLKVGKNISLPYASFYGVYSPATKELYVTTLNHDMIYGMVYIINPKNNSVVGSIFVRGGGFLDYDKVSRDIYIVNGSSVSVINSANKVVKVISGLRGQPYGPFGITVNQASNLVYVSAWRTVYKIAGANLVGNLTGFHAARDSWYSPRTRMVYEIEAQVSGHVVPITVTGHKGTAFSVGDDPSGGCFDPNNGNSIVTNYGYTHIGGVNGTISIVNPQNKVVATVTVSGTDSGPVDCVVT